LIDAVSIKQKKDISLISKGGEFMKKRAFTLIELLIVVAIIAILAAIAVPNFLEAQTRSKVSRAKADMRTSATAIESYAVDNNAYIKSNYYSYAFAVVSQSGADGYGPVLEKLTTPIAYLSSGASLKDPFVGRARYSSSFPDGPPVTLVAVQLDVQVASLYHYMARDETGATNNDTIDSGVKAKWWFMECCGPDRCYHNISTILNGANGTLPQILKSQYDPTNGTVSQGSVFRVGGEPTALGMDFFRACQANQK
jgi:prepilin-type N-terminal cleavage/methylation domain-containing protein